MVSTPHHPDVCYPGAGFTAVDRRRVKIDLDGKQVPAEIVFVQEGFSFDQYRLPFSSGSKRLRIGGELQKEKYRFWGTLGWPDTYKSLVQNQCSELERGRDDTGTFPPFGPSERSEIERKGAG